MGPDKNNELFQAVGVDAIPRVREESHRRGLLSGTLEELSEAFKEGDYTAHPITEPTLFAQLYALSQVQRSSWGIAGFNPLRAVSYDDSYGSKISAQIAPDHDNFDDGQGPYHTRVIKFSTDMDYEDKIDIFGLNIYKPDFSIDDAGSEAPKGLVLVSERGKVTNKPKPITGSTVLFAVRNTETNDARIYSVKLYNESDTVPTEEPGQTVIKLPDGQTAIVEQIEGGLMSQAVAEFNASASNIKTSEGAPELSQDEKLALHATLGSTAISIK